MPSFFSRALWWSPQGSSLVWGSFNDTQVESYPLIHYGSHRAQVLEQYPKILNLPYPKVNTTNPTVKLWLSHLDQAEGRKQILPPRSFAGQEAHFREGNETVQGDQK